VAVEKLLPAKFAKIKSRQDALQATFSVFLDIFYLPNFWDFEENGLFQHPQAITLIDPGRPARQSSQSSRQDKVAFAFAASSITLISRIPSRGM